MRRYRDGFTIIEVLMAMVISLVVSSFILGLLYFYGRTFNSTFSLMNRHSKVDMACDRLYHDFLLTARKDAFDNLIRPIKKISNDGKEIVYQVVTKCSGTNGIFDISSGHLCWGDGQHEGRYIRVVLDASNNLMYEIWNGDPTVPSGASVVHKIELLDNANFNVVGLDESGFLDKNDLPVGIRCVVEDLKSGYKKVFQVRIRGA